MIETNDKLYDFCARCGKFVRLNKPIFGSLHICERRSGEVGIALCQDGETVRRGLRGGLRRVGLPAGRDDDNFSDEGECGICIGRSRGWVLFWADDNPGDGKAAAWLMHDDPSVQDQELFVSSSWNANGIAAGLKRIGACKLIEGTAEVVGDA